jgi:hypothetical protein
MTAARTYLTFSHTAEDQGPIPPEAHIEVNALNTGVGTEP